MPVPFAAEVFRVRGALDLGAVGRQCLSQGPITAKADPLSNSTMPIVNQSSYGPAVYPSHSSQRMLVRGSPALPLAGNYSIDN